MFYRVGLKSSAESIKWARRWWPTSSLEVCCQRQAKPEVAPARLVPMFIRHTQAVEIGANILRCSAGLKRTISIYPLPRTGRARLTVVP